MLKCHAKLMPELIGERLVVADSFAGRDDVRHMMEIIVPFGLVGFGSAVLITDQQLHEIALVFDDEMNLPVDEGGFHFFGHG
ncbi:hypothetical protein D3C72_2449660 [compost metagenome]